MSREGPLAGVRVAVTRPSEGAARLADLLRDAGAHPVLLALTRIAPPEDAAPLRSAAARLDEYDWLVFTSANAVAALAACGVEPARSVRVAAVGQATAAAVRSALRRAADAVPPEFFGESLVAAMQTFGLRSGARVLWPRAERSRDVVLRDLQRAGARVDHPVAYRSVADLPAGRELARLAERGAVDVITFTAPSAVECYALAAPPPAACVIAVIGPSTAAAARAAGLPVHVEPEDHMIPALVAALARHLAGRRD